MSDETALLKAIGLHPGEDTPRLALADLYDEIGHDTAAYIQRITVALRRVKATPDDDEPRLTYAGVCEQYGHADRAEFIRVQVEWETLCDVDRRCAFVDDYGVSEPRWKEGVCQCRGCAVARRERELFAANGVNQAEWMGRALHNVCRAGSAWLDHLPWFRRGFVESVTVDGADWLAHGDVILAQHPVRAVVLTTWPDAFDGLATALLRGESPKVCTLVGKRIELQCGGTDLRTLALCVLQARWEGVAFELPADMTDHRTGDDVIEQVFRGDWPSGDPRLAAADEDIAMLEGRLRELLRWSPGPLEPLGGSTMTHGDAEQALREMIAAARESRRRAEAASHFGRSPLRGAYPAWAALRGDRATA